MSKALEDILTHLAKSNVRVIKARAYVDIVDG